MKTEITREFKSNNHESVGVYLYVSVYVNVCVCVCVCVNCI